MTQSDGEKELVLGNKQLISLFFVVVALCGVFFAMGYIIGRNSTKSSLQPSTADSAAPAAAAAQKQSEPPAETAPEPAAPADQSAAQPAPGVQTKPAQDLPQETKQTEQKPPEPKPAEPKPQASDNASGALEAGASYLQVTALPRGDAESVVRTLREQNFPARVSESSKDGLYRVLVGPFHKTSDLAESKARLKALGFANAFVQKQ